MAVKISPPQDKADAGHHLGRDPGRIEDDAASLQNLAEAIGADLQEERGSEPDQGMGAQTCVLPAELALEPDDGGEQDRQR